MLFFNADAAVATATEAAPKASPKKRAAKKPAKVAKKKAAKKVAKKKGAKKAAKGTGETGTTRSKDVRWSEKKVAFYKAIKKCADCSGTSEQIAAKSGEVLTSHTARHFGYHGVAGGLVKLDEEEGTRGYVFTLTAKGKNTDPVAEMKKQNAGKAK